MEEKNRGQFVRGHGLVGDSQKMERRAVKDLEKFGHEHGFDEGSQYYHDLRQMAKGHEHGPGLVGDCGAAKHMQHGRDWVDRCDA
jgi:hypothetical protein